MYIRPLIARSNLSCYRTDAVEAQKRVIRMARTPERSGCRLQIPLYTDA